MGVLPCTLGNNPFDTRRDMSNNLTEFDFELQNEGSLVILHPLNDAAGEWIDEHLYTEQTQWWGGGIVIEPRYVEDILDGISDVGLTVTA